jgi:hypothetical protein
MNEDGLRTLKDQGPENLALLRRLALNLAKLAPATGSRKGKLKRAGGDTPTPNPPRPGRANPNAIALIPARCGLTRP